MLQRIERLFHLGKPDVPKFWNYSFGPITVQLDPQVDPVLYNLNDTDINLRVARENGVRPLSFRDVASQVYDNLQRTVLFDTPPVRYLTGNHWRVVSIDKEKQVARLQHCNEFGNQDHRQIPQINLPFQTPFFTGVAVQSFRIEGHLATLEQASSLVATEWQEESRYPEQLTHDGETIFWSSSKGTLLPKEMHPTISKLNRR